MLSPPNRLAVAVAGLLFAATALALFFWTRAIAGVDDTYITYVFARSFAAGKGLAWPGSTALGTSSPFLAVLLGAIESVTHAGVPFLGALLGWLGIAAGSWALFALGLEEGWPAAGFVAGALWLALGVPGYLVGGEYPTAIGAVALAFWAGRRDRYELAGVFLALAAMLRAETGLAALFWAAAMMARLGPRTARKPILRAATVAIAIVTVWLVILFSIAGTIVPSTLAAKQAQGDSALGLWAPGPAIKQALVSPAREFPEPYRIFFWPICALGVAALVLARPTMPFALSLVGWGGLHLGVVALLGVGYYGWYSLPYRFVLIALSAASVGAPDWLGKWRRRVWVTAATVPLAILAWGAAQGIRWLRASPGDERRQAYLEVAQFAERFPPDTRLAGWEVGFLGWASSRPVADLLGLVSDDADLSAVRRGDLSSNIRKMQPGLLMLPLTHTDLCRSAMGDAKSFVTDFRLERLRLDGPAPTALFRKATLAPEGEIELDLLGALVDRAAIEMRTFWPRSYPALILESGESVTVGVDAGAPRALFTAVASELGKARLEIVLGAGDRTVHTEKLDPKTWRYRSVEIPALASNSSLTIHCKGARHHRCLLALTHLRAPGAPLLVLPAG